MANSKAQESECTCYACGETTPVKSWIIIDALEKPDLIEKVKHGTIHEVNCSSCGKSIFPDLPLLLYFPDDEPRFLFVSRMSDGTGYPEVVIKGLFNDLVKRSGDQELKDHYHHHQAWVLKEDLVERLKDYPDTPLKDFDWTEYPELKQLEMLMPDEYLEMVLTTYFESPDWNRRAEVVRRAPKLLTPAVEPYLERMIEGFQEQDMEEQAQIGRENLEILIRARESGFVSAVQEFQERT